MALDTYKYDAANNGLDAATVYNAQTNQPFSSGQDFLNAGGDWSTVQTRHVNVALNPSTTTNTATLSQAPVTNSDISSIIAQNQKFQESVLGYMAPTSQETQAGQKLNELQT